jgi:hypothetical protein
MNKIAGPKIKLDRLVDRKRPCCKNTCIITAGGELVCADCGQHRGCLSEKTTRWIEHIATRFGAPETITVHRDAEPPPPMSETAPMSETERQQRIELINRRIAAEGFAPKDFFLTQAPPPKEVDALARCKTRERRRRPIAQRMARWGLTAHDLTPVSGPPGKPPTATADQMSPVTATAKATPMPNIDDYYPSKFLRASDLKGKEVTVTIDRVEPEEFEQDGVKRPKPVVHFRNSGIKPLVCNKTNSSRLATALGDKDTDAWAGKQVRLYPDMEDFRGKVHEVVRVRQAPAPAKEVLNDEVPF